MTTETSLYRHYDADGTLLYVGISLSAFSRLCQHMVISKWARDIAHMTVEKFASRELARRAEIEAIVSESPLHNIESSKINAAKPSRPKARPLPEVDKYAGLTSQQKGGRIRAEKLTPKKRSESASKAARTRWKRHFAGRPRECKPKKPDAKSALGEARGAEEG